MPKPDFSTTETPLEYRGGAETLDLRCRVERRWLLDRPYPYQRISSVPQAMLVRHRPSTVARHTERAKILEHHRQVGAHRDGLDVVNLLDRRDAPLNQAHLAQRVLSALEGPQHRTLL
jgi:hypothetical protein